MIEVGVFRSHLPEVGDFNLRNPWLGWKQIVSMKRNTFIFALVLVICSSVFSQTKPTTERPNLSGDWKLDPGKSVDGGGRVKTSVLPQPNFGKHTEISTILRIVHVDPELRITERTTSREFDSAGKLFAQSESENTPTVIFTDRRKQDERSPDGRKIMTRAEWKGSSIQSTSTFKSTRTSMTQSGLESPFYVRHEDMTLSLSDDGKELTIEYSTRIPGNTRPHNLMRRVYSKVDSSGEAVRD